jgi:Ca-activated chloride channel family protein
VEKLWAVRRIGWLMDQIALHGGSESGPNKEFVDEIVRLSKDYGIMTPYTSFLADERVALHRPGELRDRAGKAAAEGFAQTSGDRGQMQAEARRSMREAVNLAKDNSAPMPVAGPAGLAAQPAGRGVAYQYGNADAKKYDKGEAEQVAGIRNVGNQTLYQRGKLWVDPAAAGLDPEKDKDKIVEIQRYTNEYFELVRQNNAQQNQLLATQQADEEIMIKLRGQVYRVR